MRADNDSRRRRAKIGEARAIVDDVIARAGEIDSCVYWPFSRDLKGYAKFTINGKPQHVHRYVCIQTKGPPPSEKHQAAHKCGNGGRGCISPFCLRWATQKENEADKVKHGTRLVGEMVGDSKIDTDTARQIHVLRWSGKTSDEIAEKLNIRGQQVRRITRGDRWAHIHPDNDPVTASMVDAIRHGAASADCRIKATDEQVRQAHCMIAKGQTFTAAAKFLGMEVSQTRRIVMGERRKSLHPDNDPITADMVRKAKLSA